MIKQTVHTVLLTELCGVNDTKPTLQSVSREKFPTYIQPSVGKSLTLWLLELGVSVRWAGLLEGDLLTMST